MTILSSLQFEAKILDWYKNHDLIVVLILHDRFNHTKSLTIILRITGRGDNYSGDLNSSLVQYSDYVKLFAYQMVCYSGALYHGSFVFRSPFGQTRIRPPFEYPSVCSKIP